MARVRAILAGLATAVRRDFKTVGSFSGNNVFVVGLAFFFLGDPGMFGALAAFIGMSLFIPLSADPLRVLPRDRLTVWPLSMSEHRALRILSVWLSPVTWLIVALAAWMRVSMGLCAVAAGLFAIGVRAAVASSSPQWSVAQSTELSRTAESSHPQESS